MNDVLVLAPDWTPMAQTTWDDAITLEYKGLVEVLERYDDWEAHSVSLTIQVPSVIRFIKGAIGWRKRGVRFSREAIYTRDKGLCQFCGVQCTRSNFTYEHVTPRCQGGTTSWTNIVVSCLSCNQRKGGRTPQQAGMRLRKQPVKPSSLPEVLRLSLPVGGKVPESWRNYLVSDAYWNADLTP